MVARGSLTRWGASTRGCGPLSYCPRCGATASVSVIFPTYNERDSIHDAIVEFLATGYVDEVVVVNNNAAPGTDEEVRRTTARLVHEPRQGYGHAIRRGFREATGDLLVVAEPDGTFRGHDVLKLLAYADDFDVVYGSRTYRQFIWTGANMGLFLRWGNYAVAKLMEFLFNGTNLTDVGCTMRLIKRPPWPGSSRTSAWGAASSARR